MAFMERKAEVRDMGWLGSSSRANSQEEMHGSKLAQNLGTDPGAQKSCYLAALEDD